MTRTLPVATTGAVGIDEHCPSCHSPDPKLHPAVQHEGEVHLCRDPFHKTLVNRLDAVADEIFVRWDKDQRSGKLLTAFAGRIENYNPDVTAIRNALAIHDDLVKALEDMLAIVDFYRRINTTLTIYQSDVDKASATLSRAKQGG